MDFAETKHAAESVDAAEQHLALMRRRLSRHEVVAGSVGGGELLKALDIAWIAAHQLGLELAVACGEEIGPDLGEDERDG